MPVGGVLTPAAAFFHCQTIFPRLREVGVDFQVHSTAESANRAAEGHNRRDQTAAPHVVEVSFVSTDSALSSQSNKEDERRVNLLVLDNEDSSFSESAVVAAPVNTTSHNQQLPVPRDSRRIVSQSDSILFDHSAVRSSVGVVPEGQLESIDNSFFASRQLNPVAAEAHLA